MKKKERIRARIALLTVLAISMSLLYETYAFGATLNIVIDPEESGRVTVNGEEPVDTYAANQEMRIAAIPDADHDFDSWELPVGIEFTQGETAAEQSFTMPDRDIQIIARFAPAQSVPDPGPSQPSVLDTPPSEDDLNKDDEEPAKDEYAIMMEQTSDAVAGIQSTVDQNNYATNLSGFAVSTEQDILNFNLGLTTGEKLLVTLSNFDAKNSPDCARTINDISLLEGFESGPAINFEIGKFDVDNVYNVIDNPKGILEIKLSLQNFPDAFGVIEITENGVKIIKDSDDDPSTVTVAVTSIKSTLVVVKSNLTDQVIDLEKLKQELQSKLAALSVEENTLKQNEADVKQQQEVSGEIRSLEEELNKINEEPQADIQKAEQDKAQLNQKIGELSAVQKELSEKLTALSNDNKALEQKKAELENKKAQLTKQLEATNKSLSAAVSARDKYQEKYKNATAAPKRRETPSRAQALSRNNAVGDGNGGYIAQGGHVQINGGKSNVTFTLAAPTSGVLSSANKYADSVGGTLLNCVTTSSPGVSFKTATVNFTVTGVYANDTIAVYQLQGKNWVQVLVSSVTDNHVTVNLTQHGPLAFVRVADLATATH